MVDKPIGTGYRFADNHLSCTREGCRRKGMHIHKETLPYKGQHLSDILEAQKEEPA